MSDKEDPVWKTSLRKHRLVRPPSRPLPCDWQEVSILEYAGSHAFIYPIEGGHLVEIGREIQKPWKVFATTETSLEAVCKIAEPLVLQHSCKGVLIT